MKIGIAGSRAFLLIVGVIVPASLAVYLLFTDIRQSWWIAIGGLWMAWLCGRTWWLSGLEIDPRILANIRREYRGADRGKIMRVYSELLQNEEQHPTNCQCAIHRK